MADWNPANGTALQDALTNCAGGDTIYLDAGVTYTRAGGFILPVKAGTTYTTLTTDTPGLLPTKLDEYPRNWIYNDPTNYRINTAEAANMPIINRPLQRVPR